jgi:Cu/Zn superoxide dismutase
MKKLSLLTVLVLLLVLATASVTMAQAKSVTVTMNPVANSGVTATATLTDAGNSTKVSITFKGFAPNSAHAGHIHQGSCENQGPVVYPLTSAKADASGNATIDAEADAPFSQVTNGQYYLNYHVGDAPNVGGGIVCGNIKLAAGQGGAAPGAPASGFGGGNGSQDGMTLWLLGGLVALLATSLGAYSLLKRKNAR